MSVDDLMKDMQEHAEKVKRSWEGYNCPYCGELIDGKGDFEMHLIYEEVKLIRMILQARPVDPKDMKSLEGLTKALDGIHQVVEKAFKK